MDRKYVFTITMVVTSFLLGCTTTPVVTNHTDFGQPSTLDELLVKTKNIFGNENVHTYENGQLIDINVGSRRNAYVLNAVLEGLCDRVTRAPRNIWNGARHSKSSSAKRVYVAYSGGFQIPIAERMETAVLTASAQHKPDYQLKELSNRPSKHCRDYPNRKMVSIPFGWQTVGRAKDGKTLHVIIASQEYFDYFLAQYKTNYDEHMAKEQEYQREQSVKREKERVIAAEAQLEKQRQKEADREFARKTVARSDNVGKRICKNGMLTYQHYLGYIVMGKPQTRRMSEPGQIVAQLDDISSDQYRIKFRVLNFATPSNKLQGNSADSPFMGDFKVTPGAVYWDDVYGWFMCPG